MTVPKAIPFSGRREETRRQENPSSHPETSEAGVAVEQLHLLRRQRPQHLLDGEELVDLTLSRK